MRFDAPERKGARETLGLKANRRSGSLQPCELWPLHPRNKVADKSPDWLWNNRIGNAGPEALRTQCRGLCTQSQASHISSFEIRGTLLKSDPEFA